MKNFMLSVAVFLSELIRIKPLRRVVYLLLLLGLGFLDYSILDRSRITLTFFRYADSSIIVEERLLNRSGTSEEQLERFMVEFLLGPSEIGNGPLFLQGTKLNSAIVRSSTAYVDLSESAALGVPGGIDHRKSLEILSQLIKKNIPGIRNVQLFIAGNEPYRINFNAQAFSEN